jgi:hypothetical protein
MTIVDIDVFRWLPATGRVGSHRWISWLGWAVLWG